MNKHAPPALMLILMAMACKTNHKKSAFTPDFNTPGPTAWVFKLKGDYADKLPVSMNADYTEIVAYPSKDGILSKAPTPLAEGYYLDNGLVHPQVAFTGIKLSEYARSAQTPTLSELQQNIISKDPFVTICNCGNKAAIDNPVETINQLIRKGELEKKCKKVN